MVKDLRMQSSLINSIDWNLFEKTERVTHMETHKGEAVLRPEAGMGVMES